MAQQRQARLGLPLVISGLLIMLMGFGGSWGIAYGQSAGPTPTPGQSNLEITKSADTDSACPADPVAFTIRILNRGASPASNVEVVDTVPDGFDIISATATAGTVSTNGQTVTLTMPQLDPGVSAILTITTRVRADAANGEVENQVVVNSTNLGEQRAEVAVTLVECGAGNNPPTQLPDTGANPSIQWALLLAGATLFVVGGGLLIRERRTS